jgi:hypothetical protein
MESFSSLRSDARSLDGMSLGQGEECESETSQSERALGRRGGKKMPGR